jgi:hypothetical protein
VAILSDIPDFSREVEKNCSNEILLATAEEYVTSMIDKFKDLEDKLCLIPYNEDECKKIYTLFFLFFRVD